MYSEYVKNYSEKIGFHPYLKKAYYETRPFESLEIFDRTQLQEYADTVYPFFEKEETEITPLSNVNKNNRPAELQNVVGSYVFDQPFVAEIRNGYILEETGFAVDNNCTVLLDSVSSREQKLYSYLDTTSLCRLLYWQYRGSLHNSISTTIDTGVSLIRAPFKKPAGRTIIASKGYSHWIQCYLTLLQGVEAYKRQTGIRPTLIVEPDPPSWLRESLNHFGYDSDDLYFWDQDERLQINRLVVPSVRRIEKRLNYDYKDRGAEYKLLSPEACRWVQKKQ